MYPSGSPLPFSERTISYRDRKLVTCGSQAHAACIRKPCLVKRKVASAITQLDTEPIKPHILSRFGGRSAHDNHPAIIASRGRDDLRLGEIRRDDASQEKDQAQGSTPLCHNPGSRCVKKDHCSPFFAIIVLHFQTRFQPLRSKVLNQSERHE